MSAGLVVDGVSKYYGHFPALREIHLQVEPGSTVALLGRNGAGKTTLLKLISRVTWPTSGRVRVAGRVVSLIELGAGFHPELTGRENVYLGAGLFGHTRREIDRRFEVVEERRAIDVDARSEHGEVEVLAECRGERDGAGGRLRKAGNALADHSLDAGRH